MSIKKLRVLLAILVTVSLLVVASPVYAIDLPDTQQLNGVEVYRHVLELNDELFLINYNLEYATNPTLPVDYTYMFRLVNTATGALVGSTTAYGVPLDYGYDRGIASIYFNAASPPTWNGAYTMYFDGNPALHWFSDTATTAMEGAVYITSASGTGNETAAANSAAANDMTLLDGAPAVDDAYYFGSDRMFSRLTLNIGTAGTPAYNPGVAGWFGEWEYYDGDSWEDIEGAADDTTGFTAVAGNHDVYYDVPTDWNTTAIGGITAYWIRYHLTEFNTLVIQPLGTQSWTDTTDPPSVNVGTFSWFDEGTVADAQDRLTTRLRAIATLLEADWGGTTNLIEDSAGGKVLTISGEEYFTNSITDLRSMCPDLFYQEMLPAEFEHDILVTDLLSSGADGAVNVWGINWVAQTFTPSERYGITGVNLLVYRVSAPGNMDVSLRSTLAGVPNGGDLVAGTYDGDSVTTNTAGEWISVAFTDDYTLTAGTTYAIVVRAIGGNINNRIDWLVDTDGGYANGQECTSGNSGVNWAPVAANDMLFEILARGGMTARSGRVEGRLSGTTFDLSQVATNWGTSTMWINAIMWIAMMIVLCWGFALAADSWDGTVLVIAVCTAIGWRGGFVDTIFMAMSLAFLAIGVIYAAFWKKAY